MEPSQIPEEVFKRLDLLAEKLGVTVDYLWPAMVAKELVIGMSGLLASFLLLTVSFSCIAYAIHNKKRVKDWDEPGFDGVAIIVVFAVGVVGLMVTTAASASLFTSNIARIIAPEAYALESMLSLLK